MPPTHQESKPWPTREEITRAAVQTERSAEEDASVIPSPRHRALRTDPPHTAANGGGKDPHAATGKDARTDAPKTGNASGNVPGTSTASHSAPASPHPSPRNWLPGTGRTLWRKAPSGAV